MNCQLSLHLILLFINQRNNSIDFESLPDAEKFAFIQNIALRMSIDDKAKLVRYLLNHEEFTVVANPHQFNAANVEQVSLMDKPQMGVVLEAIAQRLKNS